MTVTNKEGVPLLALSDRRNEVLRCLAIIGWSWQKLADRLEVKLPGALAIKNCKRPIADSDLRWLQALAEAVALYPRPMVENDPEPVQGAPVAAGDVPYVHVQPAQQHQPMVEDTMSQIRAEIAEQSATAMVAAISGVYMAAVPGAGPDAMTTEQVAGARWALGELAQSLGVLDLVQEQLRAFSAQQVIRRLREEPVPGRIGAVQVPMPADARQPL